MSFTPPSSLFSVPAGRGCKGGKEGMGPWLRLWLWLTVMFEKGTEILKVAVGGRLAGRLLWILAEL